MKSNTDDYLKYWKVIRQYVKLNYELSQADLDMLLFLYSEKFFNREKFDEFNDLLCWDKERLISLIRRGWISSLRVRTSNSKKIYQVTQKTINLVRLIYRKLSGEEIPTGKSNNKIFARNVSYLDQVYRDMILRMNAFIKAKKIELNNNNNVSL